MSQAISGNLKQFLAAAALALALPLTASAVPGDCAGRAGEGQGPRHGGFYGGPLEGRFASGPGLPLHALDLSEAQRDKIFELTNAQVPQLREKLKVQHAAEESLKQLAGAPDYSESKAKALSEVLGRAVADLAQLRSKLDRQIVEQLTPEQRRQLTDFKPGAEGERPPRGAGPAR